MQRTISSVKLIGDSKLHVGANDYILRLDKQKKIDGIQKVYEYQLATFIIFNRL